VQNRIKDIQSTVFLARKVRIANMAPKKEILGTEELLQSVASSIAQES